MMTTFDLFFKDFFREDSMFLPQVSTKVYHPVDIFEEDEKLVFEIACTGIKKEDIKVEIQGDTIRVKYDRDSDEESKQNYLYRSIAKRSFNLGWRISDKYDSRKAKASFENGLLRIEMPLKEEGTVNILTIE